MALSKPSSDFQTIDIENLLIGMYVISIIDHNHYTIESEGYITNQESINQLKKAHIILVVIDPIKTKKIDKIDRVFSSVKTLKKSASQPAEILIDQEMKKANKLYKNALSLQGRIVETVKLGGAINTENIQETTNALVDSVFRNQDALTCLTQIQSKDTYLLEHSLNVSILMSVFAKFLGFDKALIKELSLGAFLHDIGKTLLPKDILNKPSKLTENEYKIMKSHVVLGLKVLEKRPNISHIAMTMIKEHHERLDGSGYPKGLKGNEISKYGRMIAIVDSYDAMTCERPYKKRKFPISAFKALVKESPDLYDEALVEKFIQCLGVYPIGTLVKLNSGKLGLISRLNNKKPLNPYVKVFYNTRLKQAIPIEEINLSKTKYKDQIDACIKPEDFNINLLGFFKLAFID